jgi:hypothetical protein
VSELVIAEMAMRLFAFLGNRNSGLDWRRVLDLLPLSRVTDPLRSDDSHPFSPW